MNASVASNHASPAPPSRCVKTVGRLFLVTVLWFLAFPESLEAVQAHGAPKGLYAHQLGHAAFFVAMIYIWFRTRARRGSGWGLIRLSFIFFALWNINTFLVHAIQASLPVNQFEANAGGQAQDFVLRTSMDVYFYFGKMDHLLCAPAALLLGLGLRRLRRSDPLV